MNFVKQIITASMVLQMFVPFGQSDAITVGRSDAEINYPESVTFFLEVKSDVEITSVEIEFGLDVLSCGSSATRAIPEDFEEGKEVALDWEWNFRRRGPVPPGTLIWWVWRITDADGNQIATERQELAFSDPDIRWNTYETDNLNLFWLEGDQSFVKFMADAGEEALVNLQKNAGVEIDDVVNVYIYPDSGAMQDATLFAPGWSGGLAFTAHYTVLMAVAPYDLNWGQRVFAHELTHVAVGIHIFSCVASIPTWVSEGLADYNEGPVESTVTSRLQNSVDGNTLFSVRELGSGFSNDPDLARLSYAQSRSLIQFLIEEYGQEKMLALLDQFKDGASEDTALMAVYGFDRDGLEDAWRGWIGAEPREINEDDLGPTPTRTPVPTFDLSGGAGQNITASPTEAAQVVDKPVETPVPAKETLPVQQTAPDAQEGNLLGVPLSLYIVAGVISVAIVLMIATEVRRNKED